MDGGSEQSVALPRQVSLPADPSYRSFAFADEPLSIRAQRVKRAEDIILGMLLLILFMPVFLVIGLAIKLDSRGPVLFKQDRRGRNLRRFKCFKFRTMRTDATDHDCAYRTRDGDPRVTRTGEFLRRHSLDELPQLLNVVLGDMSLCGPRPHATGTNIDGVLLEKINSNYLSRYCVKPGITGWAQINGCRGILDSDEKLNRRIEFDLFYVQNWSLGFDLRILCRTLFCVFRDDQAY